MTTKATRQNHLRVTRVDKGLTLKQLADEAGLSISYLSELERGISKRPSADILKKIADVLDLTDRDREDFLESFDIQTEKLRAMLFIDGRWLGTLGAKRLSKKFNEDKYFELDYDRLIQVVQEELGNSIEITRKFYCASNPINLHPDDIGVAEAKLYRNDITHARLRERHHYDVIVVDADYRNRLRLRKEDRTPTDREPPNPVPMALATEILYYAALPAALDVAVILLGDAVYRPALEAVRRLGKRVALISIKEACESRLYHPGQVPISDWDPIFLDSDELINRVELKPERRKLTCKSIYHTGIREVWAMELPPVGTDEYYCKDCRIRAIEHAGPKGLAERVVPSGPATTSKNLAGVVARVGHRGYGFIRVAEVGDFYFHHTDLSGGLAFSSLKHGDAVEFFPHAMPGSSPDRPEGTAKRVARYTGPLSKAPDTKAGEEVDGSTLEEDE